ncbi:N-6 DNA methylase [Sphaerimonospora thailandensis]|uniref:N-6 DNA methylase n=1 Tax=Sphaerimonospora thailandensis TaxID=795644 RepID=UPI001950CD68
MHSEGSREGETVYDPACGTGGMLIEVIEHVKANGGRPQTLWGKLYGQEKVLATSGLGCTQLRPNALRTVWRHVRSAGAP